MNYLVWKNEIISDFSPQNISALYNDGFVFTRLEKGSMNQTRSTRIDLKKFELNSENRRILRKNENIKLNTITLPHPNYDWHLHKLGVDFYTKKFGEKTFSANKIKELLTSNKSNFNLLFEYQHKNEPVGYCICYTNLEILHYAYPFYDLEKKLNNLGIGMMTKAIIWAKEKRLKYVYLGSAQDKKATYKTQFTGFEWYDGKSWKQNIDELKKILKDIN